MTAARCPDCGAETVKDRLGRWVLHHVPGCEELDGTPVEDGCEHGCGREATVQHASGRVLCLVCYLAEAGASGSVLGCPTCGAGKADAVES